MDEIMFPAGTEIVTRIDIQGQAAGRVGVIVKSPVDSRDAYIIRLVDGFELHLKGSEFAVLKYFQRNGLDEPGSISADSDLYNCVIYRCIVGSRAYGLDTENSDIDRRGIYIAPADLYWSLYEIPEQLENKDTDESYWEIKKFLLLALKANPNILECLYTPVVETKTQIAEELLNIREVFLSKLLYQTYNGYVLSQFKKLERDIKNRGEIRTKHAMHLIRLLLSGITALRDGYIPVNIDEYRDELLAIKNGEMPWVEVNKWRLDLHREFDREYDVTRLPDRPNYTAANAFLIKVRRTTADF